MFRIRRALRVLPLILATLVLTGTPLYAGDTLNTYVVRDRPSLSIMTEEDGEHLRAHLMLRTEEPLTGIYVWLDFDCEALVLRECAPGELMYVSGCAVYLDTVETKRGCAVEACVLEGAYLIGRGEVVELTFARLEKGPRPLIRQVVFYGPEEEMLRDGKSMIGPEPTPTGAESGVETTSWASVKALYR